MLYFVPTDTCFGLACAFSDPQAYLDLYQLKQRDFAKPCAVLVPDFDWLGRYTTLTAQQISFLEEYPHPFTILTESPALIAQIEDMKNQHSDFFPNSDRYERIAFRVAHHPSHHDLLSKVGPLFLTSANLSNQGEIYSYDLLCTTFANVLETGEAKFIGQTLDLVPRPPSEIFQFDGERTDKIVLRPYSIAHG